MRTRPAKDLQIGHGITLKVENVEQQDDGTVAIWLETGGHFVVHGDVAIPIAHRPKAPSQSWMD